MKQVLQSARTGQVTVAEVPTPQLGDGQVLVSVAASVVSAGTERYVTGFASKNLLEKSLARPDLVRQVLEKAQREGVLTTLDAVRERLDQPLTLGYSNAGTVVEVGSGVGDIRVGDRVACAGYAVHAEVACIPRNLVAVLPDKVDFESAAFTTLGAIAQHGIRLSEVRFGELVCVIGLGLLGQLTVQLLKSAGCTVIGLDIVPARAQLALQLGADAVATKVDDVLSHVHANSLTGGADAVLIAADTPSNSPIELAGQLARDRGVVVAMGTVGLQIPRKVYYEKELDFRVSRSYGPGRYDPQYEEKGHDYPSGYVRWTENRNMQAFLSFLDTGTVDVRPLITHRFPIAAAAQAYELITGKTEQPFLGVLITYPGQPNLSRHLALPSVQLGQIRRASQVQSATVGLLGAGKFAAATLLPALSKVAGLELLGLCAATGPSARSVGEKFRFRFCTTDENEILANPDINTVVIATRHNLHARQVMASLRAGKHVFCEKPLCLTQARSRRDYGQLRRLEGGQASAYGRSFIRRFRAPSATNSHGWL